MLQAFRNKTSSQSVLNFALIAFIVLTVGSVFLMIRKQKQINGRIDKIESFLHHQQPSSEQQSKKHKIKEVYSSSKKPRVQSSETPKSSKKPSNVICEGGVCRIQKPQKPSEKQEKPIHQAPSIPFNPLSILMQTIPLSGGNIHMSEIPSSKLTTIEEDDSDDELHLDESHVENKRKENVMSDSESEDEDNEDENDLDTMLEEELKDLNE